MKLSKRNINLILIVLGFLAVLLTWQYGVTQLQEKTQTLETENNSLKSQVELYQAVSANLPTYKEEIEQMEKEIAEIGNWYPVNISREDEIMFLANMQNAYSKNLIVESVQMDPFVEVYTDKGGYAGEGGQVVHMYRQPTNYRFLVTYNGLKDMVTYLMENSSKKGIEEINLSLDGQTGHLRGDIVLNQYYMVGLDKAYQPITIPPTQKGVENIFHSVDGFASVSDSLTETVTETEETQEDDSEEE